MDGIEEKAIELIEKFEALAVDVAPDAIELGLMAARVSAIQDLIFSVAWVALAALLLRAPIMMWRWAEDWGMDDRVGVTVLTSAPSAVFCGFGVIGLLNIWSWAGIFYPELWIAKQVLGW